MDDIYLRLDYENYKAVEAQLRDFASLEKTHGSKKSGTYHKSFRLKLSPTLNLELYVPDVRL